MLRHGSHGDNVKALQEMLTAAGFRVPATGVYGSMTERAVRAYQQRNGLQVDGIAGPKTMASLSPPLPQENPMRTLPVEMAPQMSGGAGTGADGLVKLIVQPKAPPTYDVLSSIISPGSPEGRDIAFRGEIQGQRNAADIEAVKSGRPPIFSPGIEQNMPRDSGFYRETANSPFADPSVTAYAPTAAAAPGYDPLTSVQPPVLGPAPMPPATLGDAVISAGGPGVMTLLDLFNRMGAPRGR